MDAGSEGTHIVSTRVDQIDHDPCREDAAGAIGESIRWLHRFDEILQANRERIDTLVPAGDAVRTSRFLRKALLL